jgi:NOL1/NOP2/fmu family ribosome biogenesis protein
MFGRRQYAGAHWSLEHVQGCARRQQLLLQSARQLVRPGGVLVYTTCTFNPRENEEVILEYLPSHAEDALDDLLHLPGVSPGRADLLPVGDLGRAGELARCARIWPHRAPGMGHFAARIVAGSSTRADSTLLRPPPLVRSRRLYPDDDVAGVKSVVAGVAPNYLADDSKLLVRGTNAYLTPPGVDESLVDRALVPGLHVAEKRGTTWRPAHALAKSLCSATAARAVNLSDEAAAAFLSGQPSASVADDGLTLALWQDLPLGWGRQRQGVLTSLLPTGLRLSGEVNLA